VSFVVSNAVAGEPVDLTPPYNTNGAGSDPDIVASAEYKTVVSYVDQNQFLSDVPWTVSWIGNNNSDNLLEEGEKAEITVWMLRRDFVTQASDPTATGGVAYWAAADANGARGMLSSDTAITTNDQFTIEMKPESGAVLTIQRTAPSRLDTIMDLK
jgi:archaellin